MRRLTMYQLETLRFMADGRMHWNASLASAGVGDTTTLPSLYRRGLVEDAGRGRFVINAKGLRARFPVVR